MTRSEAFASYGVTLVNQQWSWSARNDDGAIVVLTFWQDHFYRAPNGKTMYAFPPLSDAERKRPGFRELVENIEHAIAHCDGVVRAVISRAKDPAADPRKIISSRPARFRMRIMEFDSATGAFIAEQVVDGAKREH